MRFSILRDTQNVSLFDTNRKIQLHSAFSMEYSKKKERKDYNIFFLITKSNVVSFACTLHLVHIGLKNRFGSIQCKNAQNTCKFSQTIRINVNVKSLCIHLSISNAGQFEKKIDLGKYTISYE